MAIVLIIKSEDGSTFELPILYKVTFGRSAACDYRFNDSKISSTHCSLEMNSSGKLLFCDLGSSNGSFVNNSLVTQTLIRVNDIIRIGNVLIKIDEKKLSTSERLAIGSNLKPGDADAFSVTSQNEPSERPLKEISKKPILKPSIKSQPVEAEKKKGIQLNKALKNRASLISEATPIANEIEQEESSGQTRFLTLDKLDKKDKKDK